MKQYNLLDYKAENYTDTSKQAFSYQQPKVLTLREKVHEWIKVQPSTNEQISEELDIVLSSVCARVRELQKLNLIQDSGKRATTKYGRKAIIWENINQKL